MNDEDGCSHRHAVETDVTTFFGPVRACAACGWFFVVMPLDGVRVSMTSALGLAFAGIDTQLAAL